MISMKLAFFISTLVTINMFVGCVGQSSTTDSSVIQTGQKTISTRFLPPEGFTTTLSDANTFGAYLQSLNLKSADAEVKYFDGRTKSNRDVYCAVVDQEIDPVDLQQCADAVMRLRGEYLFAQKKFDQIKFNFLSDGKPRYFKEYAAGNYSYNNFRKYMKYIFSYANTASLKNELTPVQNIQDIQVGDVFIQSGNPYGHAVIVVNLAQDETGNKKMMLAQSYMPAQETQILLNPALDNSPWFDVKDGDLNTPEWDFVSTDLRRF